MPVRIPPTWARISTCETGENWPRKLRRVSRFSTSGLLTITCGGEVGLAGFALACGEYLSDAATRTNIVTPAPIHTVAGKRRLECAALWSTSGSASNSSPETMYFYPLISAHIICTTDDRKTFNPTERNATRRVSQLPAILLHREQAGEIAKTQLPCVRMSLPRSERKPRQTLGKASGCLHVRNIALRRSFDRESQASTTRSDPLLLPTRNGRCRADGSLRRGYLF